jgi:hypothetical protein
MDLRHILCLQKRIDVKVIRCAIRTLSKFKTTVRRFCFALSLGSARSLSSIEGILIAALADGCNWGESPRDAAKKAKETFVKTVVGKLLCLYCAHALARARLLSWHFRELVHYANGQGRRRGFAESAL